MTALRFLFYAAAAIFSGDEPTDPAISLQCAVSAFNKVGFSFPPYKGDIEDGCDDTVAAYQKVFFPTLKTNLEAEQTYTDDQIDCIMGIVEPEHLDVYGLLIELIDYLNWKKQLDPDWQYTADEIAQDLDTINDDVMTKCNLPSLKLFIHRFFMKL